MNKIKVNHPWKTKLKCFLIRTSVKVDIAVNVNVFSSFQSSAVCFEKLLTKVKTQVYSRLVRKKKVHVAIYTALHLS